MLPIASRWWGDGMSKDELNQGKLYIAGREFEEKLFPEELDHILGENPEHKTAEGRKKEHLVGLAFSGGGIRSSTFSLGVTQALAEKGWLGKVHYLSTVSGGGYIGSSLTWFFSRGKGSSEKRFNTGDNFPFKKAHGRHAADAGAEESRALIRHLRQGSNYLTPGGGITGASLLAVILRGAMLSLLTFVIPLVLFIAMLEHYQWLEYSGGFDGLLADTVIDWAGCIFLAFAAFSLLYGLLSRVHFPGLDAYKFRRCFEKYGGYLLKAGTGMLIVGSLPVCYYVLATSVPETASGMTLAGLVSSIVSIMKAKNKESQLPLGIIAPLALAILVYGVLLLAYWGVEQYSAEIWAWKWHAAAVVILLSVTVNINYISIHRYYRDRLMELFMPNTDQNINNSADIDQQKYTDSTGAFEANDAKLHKMCNFSKGVSGPYHLINTNMVTENSTNKKLSGRGGANFLLSPLYCGSEVTGWRATRQYMGGKMNLATAMAISGAAADPHGAPGGEGLTRNKSASLLMALFNVRLGYWAPNPAPEHKAVFTNSPNWFVHGLREMIGFGLTETGRYVHIADGGHYENLALYELIRRKVKTIIVCDGGADPGYTFGDFANFIEKIRVDFGADVKMHTFLPMCPKPDMDEFGNKANPYGVDLAEQGYQTGTITYHDQSKGMLIYIKTTLIGKLPKDIYGYKSAHPDFPDETTADQFFDETQFEAYRELGYRLGKSMTADAELEDRFADLNVVRGSEKIEQIRN